MGGNGKQKPKAAELAPSLRSGKHSFAIGSKFEAKDSHGDWYGARVVKINAKQRELLVHFDGWGSRFDVWLPASSPRIRVPVPDKSKKEKEWRLGDRVIAKWGPAGKIYPATISKLTNETSVEITFFDGFKKQISKNSLKPDTEKMYRQFESIAARRFILSPPKSKDEKSTSENTQSSQLLKETPSSSGGGRGREKRKLPAAMADYVTEVRGKRRRSKDINERKSNNQPSPSSSTITRPPENMSKAVKTPQHGKDTLKSNTPKTVKEPKDVKKPKIEQPKDSPTLPTKSLRIRNAKGPSVKTTPKPEKLTKTDNTVTPNSKFLRNRNITPSPVSVTPALRSKASTPVPEMITDLPTKSSKTPRTRSASNSISSKHDSSSKSANQVIEKISRRDSPEKLSDSASSKRSTRSSSATEISTPVSSSKASIPIAEKLTDHLSMKISNETKTFVMFPPSDSNDVDKEKEKESLCEEVKKQEEIDSESQDADTVDETTELLSEEPILLPEHNVEQSKPNPSDTPHQSLDSESKERESQSQAIISQPEGVPADPLGLISPEKLSVEEVLASKVLTESSSMLDQKLLEEKGMNDDEDLPLKQWASTRDKTSQFVHDTTTAPSGKSQGESLVKKETVLQTINHSTRKNDTETSPDSDNLIATLPQTSENTLKQISSPKNETLAPQPESCEEKDVLTPLRKPSDSSTTSSAAVKRDEPAVRRSIRKRSTKSFGDDTITFELKVNSRKDKEQKATTVGKETEEKSVNVFKSNEEPKRSERRTSSKTDDEVLKKSKGNPQEQSRVSDSDMITASLSSKVDDKEDIVKLSQSTTISNPTVEHLPQGAESRYSKDKVEITYIDDKQADIEIIRGVESQRKGESKRRSSGSQKSSDTDTLKQPTGAADSATVPTTSTTRKRSEKSSLVATASSTTEKGSGKNFEQKYELFKQKWKAEKEKRRLMKEAEAVQSTDQKCQTASKVQTQSTNQPNIQKKKEPKPQVSSLTKPKRNQFRDSTIDLTELSPSEQISSSQEASISTSLSTKQSKISPVEPPSSRLETKESPSKLTTKLSFRKESPSKLSSKSTTYSCSSQAGKLAPSLTQIVASKIQKKAQTIQIQKQNMELEYERHRKEEIDLTGIALQSIKSPPKPNQTPPKRKSLDFITGRLKYKKKMEMLKSQGHDNKRPRLIEGAPTLLASLEQLQSPPLATPLPSSPSNLLDNSIQQQQHSTDFSNQQKPSSTKNSQQPQQTSLLIQHVVPTSKHQQTSPTKRIHSKQKQSPTKQHSYPPRSSKLPTQCLSDFTHRPLTIQPTLLPSPLKTPDTTTKQDTTTKTPKESPISITPKHSNEKRTMNRNHMDQPKTPKVIETRRTRKDSEQQMRSRKSDPNLTTPEFTCNLTGCNKSFRKQHLLEYHFKYFHTAKPPIKRSRSSVSVSSTDSNHHHHHNSSLSLPTTPSGEHSTHKQEDISGTSSHIDITDQSDDESESESEFITFDDCVKCICQDECDTGFMIQCEQCFTWQHGECVGYLTQKNVPLFYLCHVCSNPKALRTAFKYKNDYTFQRFGKIPPVNDPFGECKMADSALKESLMSVRHVDKEDEELLSSIMVASNAMVTDLYNIRDLMQNIRKRFLTFSTNNALEDADKSYNHLDNEQLEKLLREMDSSNGQYKTVENQTPPCVSVSEIQRSGSQESGGDKAIQPSGDKAIQPSGDNVAQNLGVTTTLDSGDKEALTILSTDRTEVLPCGDNKIVESEDSLQTIESEKAQSGRIETLSEIGTKNNSDQSRIQDIEMDESNNSTDTNSQLDRSTVGLSQSVCNADLNDQSEADTETADEQGDESSATLVSNTDEFKIKTENEDPHQTLENEMKTENNNRDNEYRPLATFGKLPPFSFEGLDQAAIVGRFKLLLEVEKIEHEIDERVQQLNRHLDVLEREYDQIDRSKDVLRDFKEKFKLPDMDSLSEYLHKIKWTSIINETQQLYLQT